MEDDTNKIVGSLAIHIWPTEQDEGGFMYDIFNTEEPDTENMQDAIDGGFCTGTIKDALEMATEQAIALMKDPLLTNTNED